MDQRKALIAVSIVVVLVLAIIIGTIFYLTRIFKSNKPSGQVVTSSSSPTASVETLPSNSVPTNQPNPAPTNRATNQPAATTTPNANSNLKTYTGNGFSLQYPKTWGLLTCTNSNNFEFDPYNSTDTKVGCDFSVKPITVLVNKRCTIGTVVKLGNVSVYKSTDTSTPGEVDYEWCTQTNVPLDITERVTSNGSRATAPGDFSPQVEQMIKTVQ